MFPPIVISPFPNSDDSIAILFGFGIVTFPMFIVVLPYTVSVFEPPYILPSIVPPIMFIVVLPELFVLFPLIAWLEPPYIFPVTVTP